MAMSKGKIVASVAGGLFVLAVGALGYLLYDAYDTRTETEQELADEIDAYRRYNHAAVFPSTKSITAVASNKADYAAWLGIAGAFSARGDKVFSKDESPAAFKQRLAQEVRRLAALPGGAEGHLAAPGFLFGFDKYLGESAVLPESSAVPRLAVQLDTISRLADMFAKVGVLEVKDIRRIEPAAEAEDADGGSRRRPAAKARGAKSGDDEGPKTQCLEYRLAILVRPTAFVGVLNALTSDIRFMVVKSFAFRESADMIVDKLNAIEAALAKKDAPERRRRRRSTVAEPPTEDAPKKEDRLIVDPELDAPVLVEMTIAVYDFGRAETSAAEPAAAAPAAPAAAKEGK